MWKQAHYLCNIAEEGEQHDVKSIIRNFGHNSKTLYVYSYQNISKKSRITRSILSNIAQICASRCLLGQIPKSAAVDFSSSIK